MPLFGVFLQKTSKEQLDWLRKPEEVHESETLKPVVIWTLLESYKFRQGSNYIENKQAGQIADSNLLEVLVCTGLLDKVQANFDQKEDINNSLNVHHGVILLLAFRLAIIIIHCGEYQDKWCNNQIIDDEKSDPEIPNFAECTFRINEIPLKLGLIFANLVILIDILVNIVDHHFLQV